MRIYYADPALRSIQVDRERLVAFLQEHGVADQDIKRLCIRIRHQIPKQYPSEAPAERILGSFNNSYSVYVCTKGRANNILELNRTLLHELRHYMKKGYQPGETKITYWDRPSEVDARAFAEQHGKTHVFLSLIGNTNEPVPAPVAPTAASARHPRVLMVAAIILLFLWKGGSR